jgi:hypothetical protein
MAEKVLSGLDGGLWTGFAQIWGVDNFPGGGKKQIPSLRYGMTSKGRWVELTEFWSVPASRVGPHVRRDGTQV